jgi:Uma2 family endonuclease
LFTPEEYLILERGSPEKSEYLHGEIYAMAGGSPEHSAIVVNLTSEVRGQLRGKPCQAFSNDLKVRTSAEGLYAYPDLSIVCGEPQYHDEHRDVLTNPTVVFEVLSPSTEDYDRNRKFLAYQTCGTLTDYVLIAQDEPRADYYARQGEDKWLLSTVKGLDGMLSIVSVDCVIRLAELYERVEFPK